MKQRIEYIDAIRGFAILLVVMAHTIAWNYVDWHDVCLFNQSQSVNYMTGGAVWQVIYSFHMALFFMVSGYLTGTSLVNAKNLWTRVKSKTIRLLIPYIGTFFLIYIVRGSYGYWFLLALYEMAVLWLLLSFVLNKINKQQSFWIDFLVLGFVYVALRVMTILIPMACWHINFGVFIGYYIPFCFGVLMKRHEFIEKIVRTPLCFSCCLIAFVVLFVCRYWTDYPQIYQIVSKIDFFFSILALLACAMIFHVFMNGINKKVETIFAYLGKVSMPIYILHNLFTIQIVAIGNYILQQTVVTSLTLQIVYSFVFSAIAISLSVILYKILIHSRIVSLLFFGEQR